ncbi:hypothetical protein [Streptomyces sp. NPDC008150]|uniref:hypothetical protein n=1 Tax=Streptomyces sp. NPDC008150 TaxID=3364816 RepID=UPI0036E4B0FA
MPAGPPPPVPPVLPDLPDVPRVKKDRRVLRAALRWTAAVVVFAAVGASVAYGITRMERTDVPGLATVSDGRWDYPEIVRPPLPSGSPRAFAPSNLANVHYADLRELLLAAPAGATADTSLRGQDGWLPTKDFLAQFASEDDRDTLRTALTDNAVRHIAATGWTAADGTRTGIYLLQFDTGAVAQSVESEYLTSYDSPELALKGAADMKADESFPESSTVAGVDRSLYAEAKPYGATQSRQAYLTAGDVVALVVQSRKGGAEEVPFQQTVTLQSELLG